jgi:signal transduction histidine kinase
MNCLWIRMSLVFTAVFIVAVLAITFTVRLTNALVTDPATPPPPEVKAYFQQLRQEGAIPDLTTVLSVVVVVAIGAGVWMSRSMTAPLAKLEEAAQAVGRQDFSQRVPVRGSRELVAVSSAFNEMASQLEQAETLRRKLLADVAHELRHPIHLIQGNLQAILDDVYPLSKEEIARLADQTHHLTALVNDLHELAQAEAHQLPLHRQRVNFATLVKESAEIFKPLAAARNVTLRVELLGTMPPPIKVDVARMRQAIQNLLHNALRHTPEGGAIIVSVEQMQGKTKEIQVRVQDTGEGIAPQQLPCVFERFYRTDQARSRDKRGTGLGLALVKATVEAHGGHIEASSPGAGQGSTFTLSLPLVVPV